MGIVGLRSTNMKENNGNTSKALEGRRKSGEKRESQTVEKQPTDNGMKKKSDNFQVNNREQAQSRGCFN